MAWQSTRFARAIGSDGRASALAEAHAPAADPDALDILARALGPGPFAVVMLFVSPQADFAALMVAAKTRFHPVEVIGCTTAGEISSEGYAEGEIVAVALPEWAFDAEVIVVEDLSTFDAQALVGEMIRRRHAQEWQHPDWEGEFAFLMVDGLSMNEDALVAAMSLGLGPVPLFGGSAGDGLEFANTFVSARGRVMQNAAVLCFVRSAWAVKVFNLDHLVPTSRRMVVTGADAARRVVHELNAEPAALEYARLLGKDPGQLTTFTFAAHPLVVTIGGQHHVRSIQRMDEQGNLHFFSAIDEGLVLTLAEPLAMAQHLAQELSALGAGDRGAPVSILACDCILRRIEAQEKQLTSQISDLLRTHRVVGFSTYGEQLGGRHVNQTMTGVAFYAPDDKAPPIHAP